MKITFPAVIFTLALAVLFLGVFTCEKPRESNLDDLQVQYDSIMQENARLEVLLDSIGQEIIKSDSIIIYTKETIYVKTKDVLNLNADSTIRLFNSWTRQLQDSLDKKRHVLNLPNFSNQNS
jgi:hypothetical protein